MDKLHLLKIMTASYDNNEELKNGKVDTTVQLSKCVVLAKRYEQPRLAPELEEVVTWNLDDDYVDSDESDYVAEIGKNSYEYELSFILKAVINHLPDYHGHKPIQIITTKTNITKGFSAINKLARYLKSNNAKAEYNTESIEDFCDYIAYDLAIFKTRGVFGKVLLSYLPRLIQAFMDCTVDPTFRIETYNYKSYHRGELTASRVARYTKNGKISASDVSSANRDFRIVADLRNECVVGVKSICDRLANYTEADIQAELNGKIEARSNKSNLGKNDTAVPLSRLLTDEERVDCARIYTESVVSGDMNFANRVKLMIDNDDALRKAA